MRNVMLASAIALISLPQTGSNTVAGSWAAEFKGQTFVRLEIGSTADVMSGTLAIADIQVDDQGRVKSVGELPREAIPLFDVSKQASTVTFSRKDGDDTDRFEFRLLTNTSGELRFLLTAEMRDELAADGIPVPKPIVLSRLPSPK